MDIVGTWLDGRTVAKKSQCDVVASGDVGLSITIPELDHIETILQVQVDRTSPPAQTGVFSHKSITNNVVALTLMDVSVGNTLCWQLVAVGI